MKTIQQQVQYAHRTFVLFAPRVGWVVCRLPAVPALTPVVASVRKPTPLLRALQVGGRPLSAVTPEKTMDTPSSRATVDDEGAQQLREAGGASMPPDLTMKCIVEVGSTLVQLACCEDLRRADVSRRG